jgi:alpha-methylacyl-CoA racemase
MGPLSGLRVLEIASLAPGPFACTVLADLGAEVLRVDRSASLSPAPPDPLGRTRRSVAVDLKAPGGAALVRGLVIRADVLVEGYRPGVMERLGLGPEACLAENPRLVYGRMTGWGQDGPLAERAGHDINYIGLAGVLEPLGRAGERPHAPMNLIGDFGGGGMLLVVGVLAALFERSVSGLGQVVDAAMVDGASLLAASFRGMRRHPSWSDQRGSNLLDGGAPFYDTYQTSDGGWMAVGAIEPAFYANLIAGLGLAEDDLPERMRRANWDELRNRFTLAFKQKTRDEWSEIFERVDACVTPVLSPDEAPIHPHNLVRESFVDVDEMVQPAPAPRFGRTPTARPSRAPRAGEHTDCALLDWGIDASTVAGLRAAGVVMSAESR